MEGDTLQKIQLYQIQNGRLPTIVYFVSNYPSNMTNLK